jgi:hypothetical protein
MPRRPLVLALALVLAITATLVVRNQIKVSQNRQKRAEQVAARQLQQRALFKVLQPVTLANCTLERFGEPHDGGYLMCANLMDGAQAAYSYGISGYDKWGCDVSTRLKVRLHQYDCFNPTRPVCQGGDTVFHDECVGAATTVEEGRTFDTILNQLAKNGDAGKRIVLKMDVEGAEWDSFLHAPDELFRQIDQMAIEFHGSDDVKFLHAVRRLTQFFHVVNLHFNNYSCTSGLEPFPSWAYEVLLVNKRLGVVDPGTRAELPHPLDAPNNAGVPDCQKPAH